MVAFWTALAARFITDWLGTKVNLDDLNGGGHGNEHGQFITADNTGGDLPPARDARG